MMVRLGSIVLLCGLATAAWAQAPSPAPVRPSEQATVVERQVKGRAGRNIRLVTIYNIRPDCSSGPLPTVRLATPPSNGRVIVQRGRIRSTNIRQCLAAEVPALVAIYRSAADFDGSDSATLEVRFEGKPPLLRRYTISVTKVDDGSRI